MSYMNVNVLQRHAGRTRFYEADGDQLSHEQPEGLAGLTTPTCLSCYKNRGKKAEINLLITSAHTR
jgi:hypothetical protein